MNLTNNALPLVVTSFDAPFSGTVGSTAPVQVWTRPGTYAGFTASNVGWTLTQTVNATRGGSTVWVPITLTTPIPVSGLTAVYLHCVDPASTTAGIRYTGTGTVPPVTTWSNADLTLFSDVSRTGNVAFAGTQFTPRTFSGVVHYTVVPEPASLAVLGFGALAALARRRKR